MAMGQARASDAVKQRRRGARAAVVAAKCARLYPSTCSRSASGKRRNEDGICGETRDLEMSSWDVEHRSRRAHDQFEDAKRATRGTQ